MGNFQHIRSLWVTCFEGKGGLFCEKSPKSRDIRRNLNNGFKNKCDPLEAWFFRINIIIPLLLSKVL